ncbi:MAG: hypothetical protein DHS20C18_24190 [Saprospiraceae bacterium]|nr:MAG: hypothetical protein DHS20C18_24190 [Saprospiraceae bacterium]
MVAFSAPMFAQISVNPKIGVNVSALDAKLGDITAEARTGWNVGADLRLGKGFLFLNPGLHYYNQNARLTKDIESPDDFRFEDETTIQSVKVPINIGVNITGQGGLLGLYVKGGIVPTYVTGVKERPSFDLSVDDLNRLTYGANVGVGVDILLFTVDLNYEIGMKDFFKDTAGKNNVLTLSAGLKF